MFFNAMTNLSLPLLCFPLCERIHIPTTGPWTDANIHIRHPGERADWVWHPEPRIDEPAVVRFILECESPEAGETVVLHLSADQRFQFQFDGELVARGPDRCAPDRWTVQSYRLHLTGGRHRLEALVWWIGATAPHAQMSHRGGFLCATEDLARFGTGHAPWRVERLDRDLAFAHHPLTTYFDAGPCVIYPMASWHHPTPAVMPVTVAWPPDGNPCGVRREGWRLEPSRLPEQHRELIACGRIRAVMDGDHGAWREGVAPAHAAWHALLAGQGTVTIPAHTVCDVLWDLETYRSGACEPVVTGGAGTDCLIEWAESLYEAADAELLRTQDDYAGKGNRSAVEGKLWKGVGDRWLLDGSTATLPSLWWRSGRFLRLRISTAAQPLVIQRLAVRRTGYPFVDAATFCSDDPAWERTRPLLVEVLRACAHETWVDTPYYEQMCYVADSRLDCLATYVTWEDDRVCARTIELLDWSGQANGLVSERFPSRQAQVSTTFAMLWVLMVDDHLAWRGDRAFTRERLVGLRGLLEHVLALRGSDGLLGRLPGWSFIDWVRDPAWPIGTPPGALAGQSSIVNLVMVLALQAAARIECAVGETVLAQRCTDVADAVGALVARRWWDESRGLMRDDDSGQQYSEHAQALALLAGVLTAEEQQRCLGALDQGTGLTKATISFAFYVHEALYRGGRAAAVERRLVWWTTLPTRGLLTTIEQEDPTRSDCHAWGAHPLFHEAAAMAGVRPLAPGLERVLIAPQPGSRGLIDVAIPHPRGGHVVVRWERLDPGWRCWIELPEGVNGIFRFAGQEVVLHAGINQLTHHNQLNVVSSQA